MNDDGWVIDLQHWGPDSSTPVLVVSRGWDGQADSEGPALYTRQQAQRLADQITAAADSLPDGTA